MSPNQSQLISHDCIDEMKSDLSSWRIRVNKYGRQSWHHLSELRCMSDGDFDVKRQQTDAELHFLGLDNDDDDDERSMKKNNNSETVDTHEIARKGMEFYGGIQMPDGHWAGDYGGPLFLMPGLIITCYVTGTDIPMPRRSEMIRYLISVQLDDGGWGLHIEDRSTVFGTCLSYVSLRLLGVEANHPAAILARKKLHQLGGALGIPSWGKFWLAVLNCYSYDGLHSFSPDLWLLPDWLPVHPSKLWCHTRQIYLPISYIYSVRLAAKETPLVLMLRDEIFSSPFDSIPWSSMRNNVAPGDLYRPHTYLYDAVAATLDIIEWSGLSVVSGVRSRSLEFVYEHVCADDSNTDYLSIAPISKQINMLVRYHHDGMDSEAMAGHRRRIMDYMWLAPDGMKMNGTNGSQFWDTAFSVHAYLANDALASKSTTAEALCKASRFIECSQVRENTNLHGRYYRALSKGGWPFSTVECGWIVSDCTAEGLRAAIALNALPCVEPESRISKIRLRDAADLLLHMQNPDGGWASYERKRGGAWLEWLNPAEVFGDIMVDYTYVECSSACMQGLKSFSSDDPHYRNEEVKLALDRGLEFVLKKQRDDGSWEGSWGVCFTYGTWFGLEALNLFGLNYSNCEPVRRACDFLVSVQRADGGWGESFLSCVDRVYTQAETSMVVNTSWALLGLIAAHYPNLEPLRRAIHMISKRQLPNGSWAKEKTMGVFNKNCSIVYSNYENIFPIWALGSFNNYSH